ncbi:hypothetical protein Scep_030552 [Stephania cephalantha]|uniref:Rx N-terminal domain-containing protein n=1 Tax=Stephania cephalantha TaxID=152367 RepID=A0AAP0DZZ8_9MAGN
MAEAIVGILLNNLESLIKKELSLLWNAKSEMKKLSSTLTTIQAVLVDAETQQITKKAVQDWLNKLKDATYDANDILDKWATDESLFRQPKVVDETNLRIPEKTRHLLSVISCKDSSSAIHINHPNSSKHGLHTLMMFINQIPFPWLHDFSASHLTCLKTLHLKSIMLSTLPPSIGELKHLRYLNLSSCGLESLPESICKLRNLQMLNLANNNLLALPHLIGDLENLRYLKLSHNKEITSLPETIRALTNLQTLKAGIEAFLDSISSLHSLKHSDTRNCSCLKRMPNGIGSITALQTLRNFMVGREKESDGTHNIKELQGLNLLRGELEIAQLGHVKSLEDAKGANLMSKPKLSKLKLDWGYSHHANDDDDDDDNDDDVKSRSREVFEGLQPHPDIKKLEIISYPGVEFPTWMRMRDPTSSFPRLVEIILHDLDNLEEWTLDWKENESLPALQVLHLHTCSMLWYLPYEICYLRTLKTLRIHFRFALHFIPDEILSSVTSLESLDIWACDSLESFPVMGMIQMQHSCLRSLEVKQC